MVELLLDKGCSANQPVKKGGLYPLHLAINQAAMGSYSKYAASANYKKVIEILLKKGVDVNARDERLRIPLHYASYAPQIDNAIVDKLIESGADMDAEDRDGNTPRNEGVTHSAHKTGE